MCCKKIALFCVHSNIDGYIGFKKKAVSKIDPPRFSLATMLKLETEYIFVDEPNCLMNFLVKGSSEET